MKAMGLLVALLAAAPDAGVAAAPPAPSAIDAGTPVGSSDSGAPGAMGLAGDWRETNVTTDVVDTLLKDGDYTGFLKCLAESDLAQTLKGPGPYTVLAPTDAAFAKLKKDMAKLLADPERLKRTVLFHVMPGRLTLADLHRLRNGDRLPTLLEGKRLKLSVKKDVVKLDRTTPVKKELVGSNGIIIPVDTVLMP